MTKPDDDLQALLIGAVPNLRAFANSLCGDPTRADDLVQDTLARAWEKRALWLAGTDLRAWLFTIMHNVFVNQRAMARRDARNVSLDDADAAWQLPVAAMQFTRVELMETMQSVARLPVEQREVLVLAAIEELRYDEIATVMGIPVGTVMSRLSRAREKLRRTNGDAPMQLKMVK